MVWQPVNTKKDFVTRYKKGEFGNRSPTWDTLEEFLESGYTSGPIHIRNRIAGAQTWYDVANDAVPVVWKFACNTYSPGDLYLSAMCPTEKTIFQGEVQELPGGLRLYSTTVPRPMREALQLRGEHHDGLTAKTLLEYYLDQNSIEWLRTLLDRYPGHVVEFSTFSVRWGTDPGFNTVFWEVRNY